MTSPVSTPSLHLQDDCRTVRRLHLGGAAGALCLAVLVTSVNGTIGGLHLLVLAGYVGHKVYRFVHGRRLGRRFRLEELFVVHSPDAAQVRRCEKLPSTLWTNSLTLRSLQALVRTARDDAIEDDEAAERVASTFTRILAPLQLPRLNAGSLVLMGVVLTWHVAFPPDLSLVYAASVLLISLMAAVEIYLTVVRLRQRRHVGRLVEALADWTLAHYTELLTSPERPYRHTLHYRAPAWFARPPSSAERTPLRRVA